MTPAPPTASDRAPDLRCPACRSHGASFWGRDRNRREGIPISCDTWRCDACRSLFLWPLPSFEEITSLYNEHDVAPAARSVLTRVADRTVDLWALLWSPGSKRRGEPREAGEGRRLLSIGCGYATGLRKYVDRGWRVTGCTRAPRRSSGTARRSRVSGSSGRSRTRT